MHNTIMTRDKEHMFRDVPFYYEYCFVMLHDFIVENLNHLLLYCARTIDLYYFVKLKLNHILGTDQNFTMEDLLIGRQIRGSNRNHVLFNLIVQTGQAALIQNKKRWDSGFYDRNIELDFNNLLLTNAYQIRRCTPDECFEMNFCGPHGLVYNHHGKLKLQV